MRQQEIGGPEVFRCRIQCSSCRRGGRLHRCWSTAIATWIFRTFRAASPDVLAAASAAGVGRMVTISTHVARFDTYRALAEAHESIFCTRRNASPQRGRGAGCPGRAAGRALAAPALHRDRRGRPRLPLRQEPARRAAAGVPHAYRGGARNRPAAGHPCPRTPTTT